MSAYPQPDACSLAGCDGTPVTMVTFAFHGLDGPRDSDLIYQHPLCARCTDAMGAQLLRDANQKAAYGR